MVKITVLASGSSGNGYLLENDNSCLIIEAGVKLKEIKQALDYNMGKICGCIVTHEHKDHCGYIKEYIKNGIKCYMSGGTASAINIDSPYIKKIIPKCVFNVGEYKVLPFNTKHDCSEPVGYLINNAECGNILFATDTYYLPNKFKNLNHILIECNYSAELLEEDLPKNRKKRLLTSHLSLETCIDALQANDLSKVQNVVLIHLSNNHSNATEFKERVESETGIPTTIAEKGVVIAL
jgi:phosphoribosyl 1,2-cyclic phosphodiesterase